MDGSYNAPINRSGQNPMSPSTPSSASYQVNVNRSKTKKWVEAKTQNYDGDDWGADEYDDEDEDDEPPVPQPKPVEPLAPRGPTQLPSATRVPSGPQNTIQRKPPADAGPPPLHVQTQPRQAAEPAVVSDPSSVASPSEPQVSEQLVSPQSAGAFHGQDGPRVMSPASRASGDKALPLVRPSDIYRRMEEEKEKERQSLDGGRPSVDAAGQIASPLRASMTLDEPPQDTAQQGHEADRQRFSTSPQLPNVARMSGFGFDMFTSGGSEQDSKPAVQSSAPVTTAAQEEPEQEQRAPAPPAAPATEFAIEPEAPITQPQTTSSQALSPPSPTHASDNDQRKEMERQVSSEPGANIIIDAAEAAPPAAESTETGAQRRPSLPGGWVSENPTTTDEGVSSILQPEPTKKPDVPEVSPISEQEEDTSKVLAGAAKPTRGDGTEEPAPSTEQSSLDPLKAARSLPPLRTPSPHATQAAPLETVPEPAQATTKEEKITSPATVTSDITPVEPLQPRRPEQSPSDYDPEPLGRAPTFSTVTSSPLKDSDLLSDEIIKSLSPGPYSAGPKSGDDRKSSVPGVKKGHESSYTLSGYDDYWADSGDKSAGGASRSASASSKNAPEIPADTTPVPPLPVTVPEEPEPAAPAPPAAEANLQPIVSATPSDSRKRFSWEAPSEATPPAAAPTAAPATATAPTPSAEPPKESPATSTPVIMSPIVAVNDSASLHSESSKAAQPPTAGAPGSMSVHHQVSNASTAQPPNAQTTLPEPPSPVSLMSDRNIVAHEVGRAPLATELSPSTMASNPTSPPPAPEGHSALGPQSPPGSTLARVSTSTKTQVPTFKDIMGLSSSTERIAKYEETRHVFASRDSGALENWMVALQAQHPEHSNATSSFYGAAPLGPAPSGSAAAAPGAPPAQQPYYQQYLNATPGSAGQSPGRSKLGGLPIPSQVGGAGASGFGNSGDKIGTKSKELMHSAGKLSKGLLSKGKSKLRGTGDKQGESTPPPVQQPKSKAERRTSWALSLGPRSRTDGPDPHGSKDVQGATGFDSEATGPAPAPMPTPPPQLPQLPQPSRLSPFNHGSETSPWGSPIEPPKVGDANADHSWLSLESPDPRGPGNAVPNGQNGKSNALPADRTSDDWVVVPRQSGDQLRTTTETTAQPMQKPPPAAAVAQDSGVGLPSQSGEPHRNSSFIGLPPIRRGSTFGLSGSERTTRATERFPLDDEEEDDDKTAVGTGTLGTGFGTNEKAAMKAAEIEQPMPPVDAMAKETDDYGRVMAQTGEGSLGTSSMSQQATLQGGRASLDQSGQSSSAAAQQPFAGQAGPPGMQPQPMANPIQRLPPSGPWKLEESHLSEPLHVVTRNRAGTGSSQQPYFGYDKETGVTYPTASPTSPSPGPPPRQRTSDVPPSSAQRYPDLFHQRPDQQRPRADSRTGQLPQQFQGGVTREDLITQRPQGSEFEIPGVGPPSEERGRQRRGSGVFKDIGSRIARATSRDRERRNSVVEPRPPPVEIRPDDVSVSSVATEDVQERKKKRTSFLVGLRGRPSMDQVSQMSQRRESMTASPQPPSEAQTPEATPQKDRKRSLLGAVGNFSTSKLVPGGLPRASTSSLAMEQSADPAANGEETTKPAKKRFSGMAKMSTITGAFRGAGHGQGQEGDKPGTSHSTASRTSSQQQAPPGAMGPPEAPGFHRTRSGTVESMVIAQPSDLPPPKAPENEGKRSRRGSAAGLLNGLKGHVSALKNKEPQQQPQQQPPPVQYQQLPVQQGQPQQGPPQQGPPQQGQPQQRFMQQQPPGQEQQGPPQQRFMQQQPPVQQQQGPPRQVSGQQGFMHQQPQFQQQHPSVQQQKQQYPPMHQQQPVQQSMDSGAPLPGGQLPAAQSQDGRGQTEGGHPPQVVNKHLSQQSLQGQPSPLGRAGPMTPDESPTDPQLRLPIQQPPPPTSQPAATFQQPQATTMAPPGAGHERAPSEPLQASLAGTEDNDISRPVTVSPVPSMGRDMRPSQTPPMQPPPTQQSVPGPQNAPQPQNERPGPIRFSTEERNKPLPPVDPAAAQTPPAKTQTSPFDPRMGMYAGQHAPRQSPPINQQPTFYGNSRQPSQTQPHGYRPSPPPGQQHIPQQQPGQGGPAPGFMGLARTSTNTSGPGGPQGHPGVAPGPQGHPGMAPNQGPVGPPGQQNGPPASQEQGQGSRWKGLRNRMSEQMAQIAAPSHDKPEKTEKPEKADKVSATKLLGAFKRNSKQAEAVPVQGQPPQQQQQHMGPGQFVPPGVPQGPYGPQQGWRPPPGEQQMAGQGHAPYAQYQHQRQGNAPQIPSPTPVQHQFQVVQPGSGMQQPQQQPRQQQQSPPAQWPQGQPQPQPQGQWPLRPQQAPQGPPTPQKQKQKVQQGPEPQYDAVPIPQGYMAVHGGQVVPSAYNVGRSPPPGQYYSPQQQQFFQQGYHQQRAVSTPMHGMVQQQQSPPLDTDRRVSDGPGYVNNQAGFTSQQPTDRPDAARGISDVSQASNVSSNNMNPIVVSPEPNQQELLRPQPEGQQRLSSEGSQGARTTSTGTPQPLPSDASVTNGAISGQSISRDHSATPEGKDGLGQRRDTTLGVDVDKAKTDAGEDIYDATPRITKDAASESRGPTEKLKVATGGEPKGAFSAELEDTFEAHARKQRLESQEEKIHYNPEDDVDHVPQMSATSYPGQEWNPYGEFEYGDWREE